MGKFGRGVGELQFNPQLHIMCKDALMPVEDGLPHFAGFPANLGGTDEKVNW